MIVLTGEGLDLASIIPIRWRVKARVQVTPSAVYSGSVEPDQDLRARLIVQSEIGELFRIRSVRIDEEDVPDSFDPKADKAGRHDLDIHIKAPGKHGIQRRMIRIGTDLPGMEEIVVP